MKRFIFCIFFVIMFVIFAKPKLVLASTTSFYQPTTWSEILFSKYDWAIDWSILPDDIISSYAHQSKSRSVFLVDSWAKVGEREEDSVSILPKFSDFEVSFYLKPIQGADRDFVWNYLDENNYYQLHFSGSAAEVTRQINDNLLLKSGKNVTLRQNQEYLIRIKSTEGKIEILLDGELLISTIDWTYSLYPVGSVDLVDNYKFGFLLAPGTAAPVENEFRDLRLQPVGLLNLNVPFYRQNDERWSFLQYDHADNWSSNPTMARWGCVVTSAAMVFNYHGLKKLPDGLLLTPQSLNLWLVSQPDGYVGNGFVNWLALTRLSREIHSTFSDQNLPKFEFTRFDLGGNGIEKLKNLLNQNIPVIGHVPGHFLVITGSFGGVKVEPEYERGPWVQVWDQVDIVWQVNDPLFSVEKISGKLTHPNGSLQSVRVLLPSQTDQSYWLFEHSASVEIKILDALDQEIQVKTETVELWEDVKNGDLNEKQTFTTSWVEKPADGDYFFKILSTESVTNEKIKFWSYTQEAEVVFQELNVGEKHDFNYSKELNIAPITVANLAPTTGSAQEFSWKKFLQRLNQAWELKKIDLEYKYLKLKQIAEYALENPNNRYKSLVERFLQYNTSYETRSWLLGPNF